MKKVLAIVLALTMVLSTAVVMAEAITVPSDLQLSADGVVYQDTLDTLAGSEFDLKATVNMGNVRDAFTAQLAEADLDLKKITEVSDQAQWDADWATAKADLRTSAVSGSVDLVLAYPAVVTLPDAVLSGSALAGFVNADANMWEETARVAGEADGMKTLTITIAVKSGITVADVEANIASYLADMEFVAADLTASTSGNYAFGGALDGTVSIALEVVNMTKSWTFEETAANDVKGVSATLAIVASSDGTVSGVGGSGNNLPSNVYIPTTGGDDESEEEEENAGVDVGQGDNEQTGTEAGFEDLEGYDWAEEAINELKEAGVINGTSETTFSPNEEITRGMMVTMLYRNEGEPATNRSIPFADVDMDAYYANAVIWAAQNGIVTGYDENTFGPNDPILREQIAAIMYRYANYKGYDVSAGENTNILSYADYAEISEYAIAPMQYAVGSGLMKGKSESTLNPQDNATRAEIATILYRFIGANK